MTLNIEQERREFEAAYKGSRDGDGDGLYWLEQDSEYAYSDIRLAFRMWLAAKRAAMGSINHASAEDYLRARYGAYRGHFAWRELQDAFNAGRAAMGGMEVAGKIVSFGADLKEVSWALGKMPPLGATLYAAPPSADAKDSERLDFLIEKQASVRNDYDPDEAEHPTLYWLEYPCLNDSDGWDVRVQIGEHKTAREAIDAAIAAKEA